VIEREVEPGEVITQGQVLLTCAQVDVLMLSLLMDDRELSACLAGDWALTTESGEVVNGFRPFFVSPMVSGDSRKREIRFEGASTPKVTAGQALRLKLKLPSNSGGVLVPQTHINDRFGQMMVLTKEGTSLPVKVLRKKGSSAVVESSTLPKGVVLMPIMEEGTPAP
jgi:hypothetical protein